MDFWGLLISGKSSQSAISRPRPLHRRRSVGGLLQRFATWRNLLAVSSSDRAHQESPGRVSDRERSPDLGLGRRLLAHSTHWKRRRTRCVPTSSSRVCSVSHLRCPESAGNFSHQRTRRHRAAVPDFSHRFRTPQIRKRDVFRHHHRAFARSAICGAPNLREISATSARAEIAPPFRISPTDSGLRRLEKEIYGSSLFPMGEQTKPILSFGGIDRSWASSRDEPKNGS